MTTGSPLEKASDDNFFLVKNEQDETFGPVDFQTLQVWAKDGRLAPTNVLSEDATTWHAITHYPELEMDWVAEVSPGAFYGPIHRLALESLQKEGSLPAKAVVFQRKAATASAQKTQPVSTICPVVPTPQKTDAEAVRALERQLDLERQRSHDLMKELQQVHVQVATAEARAETSEKAQKHYSSQAEHAQQHLVTHMESLLQDCMTHFKTQQQELQSTIVNQVAQHVDDTFTQTQEQMRIPFAAALTSAQTNITSELSQSFIAELAKTYTLFNSTLQALQRETLSQTTQAVTQATAPITAHLMQHRQELERFGALINTSQAEHAQQQLATPVDPQPIFLAAITQAQSDIVNQVAQHVDNALTQTQEQMLMQFAVALASAQTNITSELSQSFITELTKTYTLFNSTLQALQREALSQTTQAVTQTTAPITAHLMQHRQELERFGALINTSRIQTAEAVVSAVASLLATGHGELFERTHTALIQGREQMLRATGDSQRMAIEYIVREVTGTLTQALQAGRETLIQTLRSGWADMKQQTTAVDARLQTLSASQQRLEHDLKTALERSAKAAEKPIVERTYVKAEDIEVLSPERPRKKATPEPEIIDPPPAKNAGTPNTSSQGPSIADIEQQARRELERLGAQGMNIFKRKH